MVKVKALQTIAGSYGRAEVGDVVSVSESEAKELAKAGLVKEVAEKADEKVKEVATKVYEKAPAKAAPSKSSVTITKKKK